jgi:hypothetical protein
MKRGYYRAVAWVTGLCSFIAPVVSAVVFYSTGDPHHNTTAPTGELAGSGWDSTNPASGCHICRKRRCPPHGPDEGRLPTHRLRLKTPELLQRGDGVRMRNRRDDAAVFGFDPRHFTRDDAEFFAHNVS